jgi:DNA-binding protein H-NS
MEQLDLKGLSLDELWALHEQISSLLSARILAEKHELEKRLAQLNRGKEDRETALVKPMSDGVGRSRQRQKYPRVYPKYQNPSAPEETWSGRGKQPRWLVSALQAGGKIEDFKIEEDKNGKVHSQV